MVPDPVHTHLALAFDRMTDTIQQAIQDDGYIFYRAVVPWDQETHPEPDDYKLRLGAKRYQKSRERLPGVMLFRPSRDVDKPKDPLVVMLVGETPTGGVEKEEFLSAIGQILKRTRTPKESELSLKILGPAFSGSLSSLKALLTCGRSPCYRSATILSGTVSGREAVDDFREAVSDFQKQKPGPVKVTFDTLQETDGVMMERFIEFVSGGSYGARGYRVSSIAELSEDETAYGSFRHSATQSQFPGVLRIYFPREISQLRAAYQDTTGSASGAERLPLQTLPHNFGVTGADDDTVPSFSQKQTPLSQEAVLLSIVAELRKHTIEFVVLNATDPLDTLFLSHYLRSAYPQGRIVTLGADMLFPREVEDTSLHGILALSTYSVSPSANHQFYQLRQSGVERMFPNSFEIGTYNALHSLMTADVSSPRRDCDASVFKNDCADQLRSSPKAPLYLVQYGWRERGLGKFSRYNAPPVHLSALGHDGYWPVANLGPFEKETIPTLLPQVVSDPRGAGPSLPVQQFSTDPAPVEVPNSWILIEAMGLALACGFCGSLWFASVTTPSQPLAQFAPTSAGAHVWMIAAIGFLLIMVLLILLWPFVFGCGEWNLIHGRGSIVILPVAMIAVFVITSLDILERSGLFDARRSTRTMLSNIGNAAPILAFTVASIALPYWVLTHQEIAPQSIASIRRFETLRAIQLTSGLSPILPIFFLLAAGLWWANYSSSGWVLLDGRRPRLPSGSGAPIAEDRETVRSLLSALRPGPSSAIHYLALLAIALGLLFLVGNTLPFRTIEPETFDRNELLPFLVIAWAGILGTTLRLWNIWFRTRELLLALDSSLLRRGFQRLKGFSWKPIWKFGGACTLDEYRRILAREREALECAMNTVPDLKNSKSEIDKGFQQTISSYQIAKSYKHPFSLNWTARRKAEQKLIEDFGSFQSGVASAARDAFKFLADQWPCEKEEPKCRAGQETENELKTRACERFVSLIYVSFLLVVLVRMRTLIIATSGMYILIVLSMTVYPLEPRPAIQAFLAASLAFIVAVVGLIFAQIHRDATLSHITDTKPGDLGSDFWLRMASFIALPLFTFFASQFPDIGRFFYSWLEPALQALNR